MFGLKAMVKQKQGRLFARPAANKKAPTRLVDSSNSKIGMDLSEEDSWVIVKKQRVTILIPPLPAAKQSTTLNHPGSGQLQPTARTTSNNPSQIPPETEPCMHSIDKQEKSMSMVSKMNTQIARRAPSAQPISKRAKVPRLGAFVIGSEIPVGAETRKEFWSLSTDKTLEQSKLFYGSVSSLDKCLLLNQRLRASNIERKIQNAGGLSRWLASLGLGQFVRIFQKKSINKFQLVNLTMKKLKDMGADAVGPRRKLMHAIDCLSQPYCFKST